MKVITVIFFCFFTTKSIGQTKIYNTRIEKARDVKTVINIDTQIVYFGKRLSKLYVLNCEAYAEIRSFYDTTKKTESRKISKKMVVFTIGNPDNEIVYDIDWELEFPYGYDSAKFDFSNIREYQKFKTRDQQYSFTKDRKRVKYKASYFGADHTIKLTVFVKDWPNAAHNYHNIGSLQ